MKEKESSSFEKIEEGLLELKFVKSVSMPVQEKKLTIKDFEIVGEIGSGAFGKVFHAI